MSTAVGTPPPETSLWLPRIEARQRFVIDHLSWAEYEAIGEALRDRAGLRLTFSDGRLELMSTSFEYERLKSLVARLIDVLTEELDLGTIAAGSTTFKLEGLKKGVEPDLCYYAANAEHVRNKMTIDLTIDPPPDLVVEIDVTNSSVPRLAIYAALGVPEVWRWHNETFRVYELDPARTYQERPASTAFAVEFDPAAFLRFLTVGFREGDTPMARAFRAWLRQWVADRGLTS
jgi:Uma2 family endonuclease